jgi:hypothetical protein
MMFLVQPDSLGIPFLTNTHTHTHRSQELYSGAGSKKNQFNEVCTNEAMLLVSLYYSALKQHSTTTLRLGKTSCEIISQLLDHFC